MEFAILLSGRSIHFPRKAIALTCALLLLPGDVNLLMAQQSTPSQNPATRASLPDAPSAQKQGTGTLSADQLDSLVAPIALYPDPMLAQALAASTYPLE